MVDAPRAVFEFGPFRLEVAERSLLADGAPVHLTPKAFDVLCMLVEHSGHLVPKQQLLDRVWPDTFVGDATLTRCIADLRKALGDTGGDRRYIDTVAKQGYRFVAPVRALSESPRGQSASPPPLSGASVEGQRDRPPAGPSVRAVMIVAALAVIGVAIAGVYLVGGRTDSASNQAIRSLMVLPLNDQSPEPGQEHLADGLTEALTTELARISSLRVISRATAAQYKKAGKPLEQIARELEIDAIVDGSLSRSGDRVRVTAQLIQLNPEKHLWAERYDRPFTDFLTLESDVAQAVARAIQVNITPVDRARMTRRHTPHPAAYDAYLRARYYESGAAGPAAERVIENYKQAIAADPQFALAHAGLARAYVFGIRMRPKQALETAHQTVLRAQELDPGAPEVQLASAVTRLYHEHDFTGAELEFRRAIESDPGSAEAHFYYSQCLAVLGRFEEAVTAARRAQRLDPMSPLIGHYIGRIYYFARQYDKAVEALQQALELNPTYAFTHIYLVTSYERMHDYDRALAHRQKYWSALGRPPDKIAALGQAARTSGYKGALRLWVEDATAAARRGYLTSTELAHVLAEIGDAGEALTWLERAADDHVRDLIYVDIEPGFDPLRSDPRFTNIVRRIAAR